MLARTTSPHACGIALLALCLSCRGTISGQADAPFQWQVLTESIEKTREQSEAAVVVIAYAADWSVHSGPLFRQALNEPQVTALLAESSVDGFIADCTVEDCPSWQKIVDQGESASPPSLVIWKRGEQPRFLKPREMTLQGLIAVFNAEVR